MPRAERSASVRTVRRVTALMVGVAGAHLVRTVAFAQEAATEAAEVAEVGGGVSSFGLGDWVGLLLRLGLVLGVIWGAVAAMRWYVRRTQGMGSRGDLAALEVIETHALGPNRALHLVRLGDRAVLVGATPERITSLLTVDDPEEVRRLAERPESGTRRSLSASLAGSLTGVAGALSSSRARLDAEREQHVGAPSPLQAMTAGLSAFRTMIPAMPVLSRSHAVADLEVDADEEFEGDAVDPRRPLTSRLGSARDLFARARMTRETMTPSASASASAADAPPARGLFERTLAAAEVEGRADAAEFEASRALRARSGYAASAAPAGPSASVAAAAASVERERRIADLQRAIAEARRNAG